MLRRLLPELILAGPIDAETPISVPHFSGGEAWFGTGRSYATVYNPSSGMPIRKVHFASDADIEKVIENAARAATSWNTAPIALRSGVLRHFSELLRENETPLSFLIAQESGKTLRNAQSEIRRGLEVIQYASRLGHFFEEQSKRHDEKGACTSSLLQPLGVCVGITPSNFPLMVPLWLAPLAIACGNAFVLKPSPRAPSTPVRIAELMKEAGLPSGVMNVIQGDVQTANKLITHPRTAAVSFVGSSPVARSVYAQAATAGKRVQALGGAKNHVIVMPDADLDLASRSIIHGAYGSAGQRCMAVAVVVVVEQIADQLVDRLMRHAQSIGVMPAELEHRGMGPLSSREHMNEVLRYIESGIAEGAKLVVDRRWPIVPGHENGFYVGPCLFDFVRLDMRIYQEEIFGPVLCVVRVPDFETALDLVNASHFGNGASLFTRDARRAHTFSERVEAGMVGINVAVPIVDVEHGFGGWKDSLFGDMGVYGHEGVRFFTRSKKTISMLGS